MCPNGWRRATGWTERAVGAGGYRCLTNTLVGVRLVPRRVPGFVGFLGVQRAGPGVEGLSSGPRRCSARWRVCPAGLRGAGAAFSPRSFGGVGGLSELRCVAQFLNAAGFFV